MIIDRSETPQELAFTLTLPQLRQAHEIYKKHCFFQDFIECCEERRTEETGLCNLPYQTLEHETDILCKAYELYEKQADINVSYRVTIENVIDAIEKQILNGELRPPASRTGAPCGAGHGGRHCYRLVYKHSLYSGRSH